MAMTHVILKEFYVDKETPYFMEYAQQYTDLPFLIILSQINENFRSDRFLRASDLSDQHELGEWKTVVWDEKMNNFAIPNGSEGYRWDNGSQWNLDLNEIQPKMSFLDKSDGMALVEFPYFGEKDGGVVKEGYR
jgi:nitrate reductase alpha subunit